MGILELESKRRARKGELQKIILETIKITDIIGIALVAPNVIGAMAKIGLIASPRQKDVVRRSCARLVRSGLLVWQGKKLRLTKKGETTLRKLESRMTLEQRPRRWDGKWRVLIFDIPEYRKGLRDQIRHTLMHIGFTRLQDSVWVYPYDCEDYITLLKADFRVGRDALYMIVDMIENDTPLKRHFGLRN